MWRNMVEPDRPQMTIWRRCIACCIPNATNTHSEYAILLLSTASVVAWSLLNTALCIQYLPCYTFNLVVNIGTIGLEWWSTETSLPYKITGRHECWDGIGPVKCSDVVPGMARLCMLTELVTFRQPVAAGTPGLSVQLVVVWKTVNRIM